ncbi:GntR family transcriptional regulator [Dactylosporangium matsuzakiense]|uniref:HTH gntR-type domain-containing protein n=2 Tax=Dactylosporangium matsuzakiense TaxID=53360 RepID=A0A9W6NPN9_9ACTN|nr:GntR family transcriptional regulator [Dactylosporangium matsuzakiense]GLL04694.1 hypothetical protein GCM10017581_064410 [Dactylosporangium matsuzakiense]
MITSSPHTRAPAGAPAPGIDRLSGRALYAQVTDALRQRIDSGEFPPGASLPGQYALAAAYDVSRDTVLDALRALRKAGLIETRRGMRAVVRRAPVVQQVTVPAGATITARMPTPAERSHLGLAEGVPVIIVRTGAEEQLYPADRTGICRPPTATQPPVQQ